MTFDATRPEARSQTLFSIAAAAIPYRRKNGVLSVLLVRSSTGRWLIPKGRIEQAEAPGEAAAREAWEEAGVRGDIATAPCGTFDHQNSTKAQHVLVYALRVRESFLSWPEQAHRKRAWFETTSLPPDLDPQLTTIIQALEHMEAQS